MVFRPVFLLLSSQRIDNKQNILVALFSRLSQGRPDMRTFLRMYRSGAVLSGNLLRLEPATRRRKMCTVSVRRHRHFHDQNRDSMSFVINTDEFCA